MNRNLHLQPGHPLSLLRQNIVNFMYKNYPNHAGNPIFSVYDRLHPIVNVKQNFDRYLSRNTYICFLTIISIFYFSLLIPKDHPSRKPSDCYYLNENFLLRGHTSAHQQELIQMGLNNFIVFGDVYRRDEIDSSHFPAFHQAEGVRLFLKHQVTQMLYLFSKKKSWINLFWILMSSFIQKTVMTSTCLKMATVLHWSKNTTLMRLLKSWRSISSHVLQNWFNIYLEMVDYVYIVLRQIYSTSPILHFS